MRVLLDTNIILDFLLERGEFLPSAIEIMKLINSDKIDGYLCATTITTIHYFARKFIGDRESIKQIEILLENFNIANVDKKTLLESIENNGKDFEDSVIYTSAWQSEVDFIISRDKKGFTKSLVKVLSPKEFLRLM